MDRRTACLDFGEFRIEIDNRLLFHRGEPVALTPKALDTLLVLVEGRGRVLTKEGLMEAIWPDHFVTEATLAQNVYLLRKVLDVGGGKAWIQTVARRGYRFVGEVRAVPANPLSHREPAAEELGTVPDPKDEDPETIRSLAVLPLRPLALDEDGVFLGLGLADAVITSLSNVRQLTVHATSAILRYVDVAERDAAAVGRELGVEGVLEGTVQRLGPHIRVTVQLVTVATGVPCWAESFRGSYSDLFAAQDAIAKEVVRRLQLKLTRQEASDITQPPTHSLEAHRTYVRGRYFWNRRTATDLQQSIELFREAVAQDPSYSKAYSGLADSLILLPFYGAARPADAFRQAREAARRALRIDPNLAEAHTSLAYTDFVYSRQWEDAEQGFRRAIELDPRYSTAYHWFAFLLTALGRHDEAIDLARRAQELDPLSLVISTDLAIAYYFGRRLDPAVEQLKSVIEVAPSFGYAYFGLALCLSELGHHESAIEAGRAATRLLADSDAAKAVLGFSLARGGHQQEARQLLEGSSEDGASILAGASSRALIWIGLGDVDAAFQELEQGIEERSRFALFIGVWPAFGPLRADARFDDLIRRLGLPLAVGADVG